MTLAEKITVYRKKMGMSQEGLAEKLNVSRQAISKWETGDSEPELSKIKALSIVFGVSIDNLLSQDSQAECIQQTSSPKISQRKIRWGYPIYLIVVFMLMFFQIIMEEGALAPFRLKINMANIYSLFDLTNMVIMAGFFIIPPLGAGLIKELGLSLKAMFCAIELSDDKKELCYKSAKLSLFGTLLGMASILVLSFEKLCISMDPTSSYGTFVTTVNCGLVYGIFLILAILPVYVTFSKRG